MSQHNLPISQNEIGDAKRKRKKAGEQTRNYYKTAHKSNIAINQLKAKQKQSDNAASKVANRLRG